MDTIILFGPDDREEEFSLPAGPLELVELEIDRIVNDPANDWSDSYSLYSAGREVDHHGFPVNGG
uniref:hypothetical protein n=1 Tax=Pseudomonas syringae TaxID=317 RepID=UPI001E626CC6|nr:hypothetical protein [Pseudomonas syringae]QOQ33581.1 hypothetical protein [Pseudomonas syringae pv. actinidiae]